MVDVTADIRVSDTDRAKWEARWQARAGDPGEPEPFLVQRAADLPGGRVLDVAAGGGRNALWLAKRGFTVSAIDISAAAVTMLTRSASSRGLKIAGRVADLDEPAALTGLGPFDLVVVVRYRPSASQWAGLIAALRPGGLMLLCSFAPKQHERHGFPREFCLEREVLEAELEALLQLQEWTDLEEDGQFLAGSVWRKPAA